MSIKELEFSKKYIKENLKKGFIKPSEALFVLPILIVKKLGPGVGL